MRSQEFTLLKETTLGGFPVKVLKIQNQGVEEAGNANSGRRGPNSPPDNSPVTSGRVEKTATGIRHHADPSRYGGYDPEPEDDRLLGPQQRWRLSQAVRGVGEEASPMIKPPASRFDSKQAAFAHVREHGGKVFRSTYTDPNTGNKQVSFVVKKEQGVAEGAKPGWMLKQNPALDKKVKDSKAGHQVLKKWAGKTVPKDNKPGVAEGWKEKLGAATVAGAMALGAGGASADTRRVTPDGQGGFTGGWKPTSTQQSTDTAPTQSPASTTQHLSLPIPAAQAQYDNATKLLTYKGKQYKWDLDAQSTGQGEVVSAPSMAVGSRSMGPTNVELNPNGTYNRAPVNEATQHLKRGVAEEINSDVFNPAFNDTQIFDELTYRATAEKGYNDKTYFQVKVFNSNFQQVGLAKFSPTKRGLVSAMTWVHPEYQGQGLARNIYAYVRSLGNTIAPSRNQLPAGKAMWASWKKSGDAKYLMNDVAEGESNAIDTVAKRLTDPKDGMTAKLRAAGDARREDKLKGRNISRRDTTSKDEWGDLKQGVAEEYNPEYDDESGMAETNLVTIARAAQGLLDTIDDHENLPEWVQEKIAKVEGMMVTAWDYLKSQEAQGIDPRQSHSHQVAEAIKLNAPQRKIPRDELQGYADRIKTGTKTKRDKFSPIIHGSNIKAITKDDENTEWDLDDLSRQITTRPKAILGTNAKMEKSKTEGEIIYDLTLPALSGIVVDEDTGDFVEITTCPGAGACQLFCYARKGGYVMFPASSMSAAQALNFLVNDPEGYSARVNQEIKAVKTRADKAGIQLVVRWHDAGDFFSKEYLDLAYGVANANPDVQFYAYTKMGDVATGATPANFTMNFSSGSKRGEEKKVEFYKQQNPGATVKQGVTVPKDMFFDLIARKGTSLIKDAKGRTQFASSEALDTFKQRIAQQYKVAPDSIITYDQMLATPVGPTPKWNVIVQPGAGDRAANRKDVIDSYLMFH